ncbi:L,D-transpeptidase [Pseudonocardia endophytica]|uniref:L,D-transpeptidase-like protein n=1 Tax=Pseudonocardia endophytica TaxID=401976 RepID=A0A4R1HRY3_PSEEN|nr:Ig-like domain-containing protein [Pseudonocardia endophytica]TCK22579.1 L,D-transpeptidase-like protein [Pseudonocardia endophytica]
MSRSWDSSRGRHVPRRRRSLHRRTLGRIVVLGVAVAALAAGGATAFASGSVRDVIARNLSGGGETSQQAAAQDVPPVLTVAPNPGTTDVAPRAPVRADVTSGELRDVALTSNEGKKVAGTLAPDRRSWTPSEPLGYGHQYTWSGSWIRPDGVPQPLGGGFGTVDPDRTTDARLNIDDGDQVGVAAPIIIQFDRDLSDQAKAAVERTLTVTSSKKAEGSWAWLPDTADGSRVHYRTQKYWPAGSKVTVKAPLYGVDMGDAGWGEEDLSSTFTIGRSQIVKADTQSHQIAVVRDGKEVARYDASYGKESDPNRVTRGGTHIVMAKSEKVLMSNPEYGYVNQPEYWAVRISNNGEFIHANPASVGAQGNRNVSHGCVNLSTKDARAYFDSAMFGDPVEVTNSSVPLSAQDGDIYDWAIPWNEWKGMSALAQKR